MNAQLALIMDPDGFSSIRESATSRSKVLDTVRNEKIVFVFEEQAEGDWFPVDYKKCNKNFSGYIHRSKVSLLSALTEFRTVKLNDSLLILKLDSNQITIARQKFSSKRREINYTKPEVGEVYVSSIDGKFPWGTDGNMPSREYKQIHIRSGRNAFTFPGAILRDLFEPNLDMTSAYIDKRTGKIYIEAFNSDAAGAYVVVWVLKSGEVIHREIFIPF